MLRGEAIAWLYTLILVDAINMMQKDLKDKTSSVLLAGIHSKFNNY
jgi:hypothetical protein